jgi:hypothetical protein
MAENNAGGALGAAAAMEEDLMNRNREIAEVRAEMAVHIR